MTCIFLLLAHWVTPHGRLLDELWLEFERLEASRYFPGNLADSFSAFHSPDISLNTEYREFAAGLIAIQPQLNFDVGVLLDLENIEEL